jgi:hypothetical protein
MAQKTKLRLLSLVSLTALSCNFMPPVIAFTANDESAQTLTEDSNSKLLAYAATQNSQLDEVNKQIIAKEIELLRFNTDFRNHYMAPNKNKQRRLKLYDMVGGGIANAGDIALMSNFWRYWKNPGEGLKNRGRLQSGAVVVMVAYLTLGGLYLGEGVFDLAGDYRAKRQKWDAKSVREKGLGLKADLDKLLEQRKALVGSVSGIEQEIFQSEGKVLAGIRDLGVLEFTRLFVDSRKRHTARDITTIGTLGVCATGAFIGALEVINGLSSVNLKQVGGGGIGFIISGGTLTAAPLLIHGGAALSGKINTRRLHEAIASAEGTTAEALSQEAGKLTTLLANSGEGPNSIRVKVYSAFANMLKDRQEFLKKDAKDQKKEMIESFISYAARGGPQIAFGTLVAKAGYHYNHEPHRALRAVAQGATVNEVSWGIWLADTMQKSIRNEVKFRRDANAGNSLPFAKDNTALVELERTAK